MARKWVWLPASPTGGTGGGAYGKLFRNEGLPTADLLVREVLQNSWDAAQRHGRKDAPPFRFVFRFASLTGTAKKRFLADTDLASLGKRRSELPDSRDFPEKSAVKQLLDLKVPLRLLYLEDYGTHGMFGDPAKITGSHFYKALYVLGASAGEKESQGRGGSFGFGKGAFIVTSQVRAAFAHTRFAPSTTDKATQRFLGFTWWGEHEVGNAPFEGRAMFGDAQREARLGAKPLTDLDAQAFSERLGMPSRSSDDRMLGSTVLLLNPQVTPEEIQEAVERYWWPALVDQLMQVTIETEEGEQILPRPQRNARLRPFLQAYGIATGTKTSRNAKEEVLASSRWRADAEGRKYGRLALVLDREAGTTPVGETSGTETISPTVALIRDPRMVIEYKSFSSRLPIRGVYIADPGINAALRSVEPPAHNTWDHTQGNDVPEDARKIAKGALQRIRNSVKDFAAEFAPPPTNVPTDLKKFGALLTPFLTGRVPGKVIPPDTDPEPSPSIHLRPVGEERRIISANDDLTIQRSIAVEVPTGDRWKGATLVVAFNAAFAEELEGKASGTLGCRVQAPTGFNYDAENDRYSRVVDPGDEYIFEIETAPFGRDMSVVISPTVSLSAIAPEAGA